jgi:hypothetical protein
MSRWGHIVIECSSEDCHAEERFGPEDFEGANMEFRLGELGWEVIGTGKNRRDVCPQCQDEVQEDERCNQCFTSFGEGVTACENCNG